MEISVGKQCATTVWFKIVVHDSVVQQCDKRVWYNSVAQQCSTTVCYDSVF